MSTERLECSEFAVQAQAKLELLEAQFAPHKAMVVEYYALHSRPGRSLKLSYEELQPYEDAYQAARELEFAIERQLRKIDALEHDIVIEFADEVDLGAYEDYLSVPDLRENFSIDPSLIRHASGREIMQARLRGLPFVGDEQMARRRWSGVARTLVGPIFFPVTRIISAAAFGSWAGRPEPDGSDPHYSIDKIVRYAKLPASTFHGLKDGPDIEIVRDVTGFVWGVVASGGSHRAAAAKLRGDEFLEVTEIFIPSTESMQLIPFDVRAV